jgi:hypothetical protein
MTADELIEREAIWLHTRDMAGIYCWPDANGMTRGAYRNDARSLNHLLNECGVRMLSPDNSDDPETTLVAVDRLPEAKEE